MDNSEEIARIIASATGGDMQALFRSADSYSTANVMAQLSSIMHNTKGLKVYTPEEGGI